MRFIGHRLLAHTLRQTLSLNHIRCIVISATHLTRYVSFASNGGKPEAP